jgi:hypothetical protein
LVKLEFQRDHLRKQKDEWAEKQECSEDDRMMMVEFFEDRIAAMENEIFVIKEHCSATPDEIRVAAKAYETALDDAVVLFTGSFLHMCSHENANKAYTKKLRRMRRVTRKRQTLN